MKKILLILILLFPCLTYADSTLLKDNPNAKIDCYSTENNNDDKDIKKLEEKFRKNIRKIERITNENISLATKGTYYECVAIICENGKNKEFIKNEFTQNITCQNNNKPTYNLEIPNNLYPINSSCQQSSAVDEETKGYAFIIKKYTYDCDASIKSPDTGVNNYYLVLGILIGVFTILLSIINKKNAFKKI